MATKTWIGAAADVADVYTITIASTWAAGDSATVSVGNRDLTVTLGSGWSSTTDNIASEIAKALVGETRRDGVGADYSWTAGGREYGEFLELIDVSVSASVVTLQGPPGIPVTVTASATTAGSGTATAASVQTATGKHFWNNADNWAEGTVPADDDVIYIRDTDVSIRYGLPTAPFEPGNITIQASFTGHLGLPLINRNTIKPYREYRTRAPDFGDDGVNANTFKISIGQGLGDGSELIVLSGTAANGSTAATLEVIKTAPPNPLLSQHSCEVAYSNSTLGMEIKVTGGSVGIGTNDACQINDLTVHASTGDGTDVTVGNFHEVVGGGGTFTNLGGTTRFTLAGWFSASVYGGRVIFEKQLPVGITVYNATVEVLETGASATMVSAKLGAGAILDLRRCAQAFTITGTSMHSTAQLLDPTSRVTFTNGIDLYQCGYDDVTLDVGRHRTLTITDI